MKAQLNHTQKALISTAEVAALRTRFRQCAQELAELDWISEGSVTHVPPGAWRWTRKVRAKTVTVALSAEQAEAFQSAITRHRRLQQLILEMRALSQTFLLQAIPGPLRRPHKRIPKSP